MYTYLLNSAYEPNSTSLIYSVINSDIQSMEQRSTADFKKTEHGYEMLKDPFNNPYGLRSPSSVLIY